MILLWMHRGSWSMYSELMLRVEKNYIHFGDLVSFDATYSTNQYNI
jgi:hypothetical protein